jgi:hypothetical protein
MEAGSPFRPSLLVSKSSEYLALEESYQESGMDAGRHIWHRSVDHIIL